MPVVTIIVLEAFLDPIAGILVREQGSRGTSMKSLVWRKALEENQETQTGSERPHGDNHNRLCVNLDPEGDFMVLAKLYCKVHDNKPIIQEDQDQSVRALNPIQRSPPES